MASTTTGEPSAAVERDGGWVPLASLPGAERLGPAAEDLLTFLSAGEQVHELAEELVSAALVAAGPVPAESVAAGPRGAASSLLAPPLRPAAFRDCSLWEEHLIAASRSARKR